jgi:NAD(P)H dehydrogenase (quinone)
MELIGITGASGKLGRATIGFLLERDTPPNAVVAIVRDPAKVADLAARGIQVRSGDYTDLASLQSAFRDIRKLLFISTSALGEERMLHHGNVVRAASAAQVGHVTYTSCIKPAADARFAASPGHFHTERLIRESGIPYTFFRNNLYLDIIPFMFGDALPTGSLVHNGGSGRIGFISREDIAGALAVVLTMTGHVNREYPITAVTPYGLNEIAGALGKAGGKIVAYRPVSSAEFGKALEAKGLPVPVVGMSVALGEAIRAGEFDAGSADLQGLLGRPPMTLDAFLRKSVASQ